MATLFGYGEFTSTAPGLSGTITYTRAPWKASAMGSHFERIKRFTLKGEQRITSHSFRKFHKTALEGAGVPEQWVRLLEGKSADVYSRPKDDDTLLRKYASAYDALRVFTAEKLNGQVRALRSEVETLRQEIGDWARETSEMDECMDTLEKTIAELKGMTKEEVIRQYMKEQER